MTCPLPLTQYPHIVLAHGGGGRLSRQLVEQIFLPAFTAPELAPLHDGAVLDAPGQRLAFTTDAHVITPTFFPGGDIGALAVHGTVNDLAMCGARPLWLSAAFIIEEGFAVAELWEIAQSMRAAAAAADVRIVTGDTKVVERGKGDGIFITTSGVGVIPEHVDIAPARCRSGDAVLVSGPIAAHGIAIMSVREGLEFETALRSDSQPLNHAVARLLGALGADVHMLRDPTRGGVATVLNEIAACAHLGVHLDEAAVPVQEEVRGACEILGLDPLYVANEGVFLAVVAAPRAAEALALLRAEPGGGQAAIIGTIVPDHPGRVFARSGIGGTRAVAMLAGEQLPRIC